VFDGTLLVDSNLRFKLSVNGRLSGLLRVSLPTRQLGKWFCASWLAVLYIYVC